MVVPPPKLLFQQLGLKGSSAGDDRQVWPLVRFLLFNFSNIKSFICLQGKSKYARLVIIIRLQAAIYLLNSSKARASDLIFLTDTLELVTQLACSV